MKAREYTDFRRLDTPPAGPPVSLAQRHEAFLDAFRGVDLGIYDRMLIDWCADHLVDETARGLISLVERASMRSGAAGSPAAPVVGRATVHADDQARHLPAEVFETLEPGLPTPLHKPR